VHAYVVVSGLVVLLPTQLSVEHSIEHGTTDAQHKFMRRHALSLLTATNEKVYISKYLIAKHE
jgi:hypothetical protein